MLSSLRLIYRNPKLPTARKRAVVGALHLLGGIAAAPLRLRRRTPPSLGEAPRILLLRADGIGDFVMTTPLLPALRRAYPKATIDLLCYEWSKSLADLFSGMIDRIIAVGPGYSRPSALRALIAALRTRRYDAVVDLRGDHRYVLLAALSGARGRYGFAGSGFDYLLTHALARPEGHQTEEVARIATALGALIDAPAPLLPLTDDHHRFAADWLEVSGAGPDQPIVAMHVTHAARPAKLWPLDRFAAVAENLMAAFGARILLLGGPGDRADAEAFGRSLSAPALMAAGRTSQAETAALLERCRLFIGIDSGTAHIAGAAGCPALVLFGPTDPGRYRPWGPHCRALTAGVPCGGRCDQSVCAVAAHPCMTALTVDQVLTAARELMENREMAAPRSPC